MRDLDPVIDVALRESQKKSNFEATLTGFSAPACSWQGMKPMKAIVDTLGAGFDSVKSSSFTAVAMSSALLSGEWSIFSGQPLLSAELSLEGYLKFAHQHKSAALYDSLYVTLISIHSLRGDNSSAGSFSTPSLSEDDLVKRLKSHSTPIPYAAYVLRRLWVDYTMGYHERGVRSLEKARVVITALPFSYDKMIFHACSALLLAAVYQSASMWTQFKFRRSIKTSLRELQRASDGHSIVLSLLVQAEYDRVCRRHNRATANFAKAIESSRELRLVHLEALGEELLGRFNSQANIGDEAIRHLNRASELYADWGCGAKVYQLEKQVKAVVPVQSNRKIEVTEPELAPARKAA